MENIVKEHTKIIKQLSKKTFSWYNYCFGFTLWFFSLTYLGIEKPILQNSRMSQKEKVSDWQK